jgi:uncharacterized protein (TIGR04222 family)
MANVVVDASASVSGAAAVPAEVQVNPYEIAYLRGGPREVLKLRLFELMEMGYLIVIEKKGWIGTDRWLTMVPDAGGQQDLPTPDRDLLARFATPRTATEIFHLSFPPELETACHEFRQGLWQRGLLRGWLAPESKLFALICLATSGFWVLVLAAGLAMHVPIVFLAGFVGLTCGWTFLRGALGYRPSAAGKWHLRALTGRFAANAKFSAATWEMTPPMTRLTAVAVFGFIILQGSPADAFATLLGTRQSQWGVEYGVGSDGGCGGGCGGCGGCGG